MMFKKKKLSNAILVCVLGIIFCCAQGCSSKSAESAAPVQTAPASGEPANAAGPSASLIAQNRAIAAERGKQAREAALSGWKQSHPGQKLPPGF